MIGVGNYVQHISDSESDAVCIWTEVHQIYTPPPNEILGTPLPMKSGRQP